MKILNMKVTEKKHRKHKLLAVIIVAALSKGKLGDTLP